jgi:cell division protein FtsN
MQEEDRQSPEHPVEQPQPDAIAEVSGAAPAQAPETVPATPAATRKTTDERKQLLAQMIQTQVASGARVESQSDFQAVLVQGHRVNHLLHFVVGIFTLGLWWLVWIGIAIFGGEKRMMAQVDEFGNTTVQQL